MSSSDTREFAGGRGGRDRLRVGLEERLSHDAHERQTAALHRLLSEAGQGGQAKVDALIALMQRTVFVVPWPAGVDGYRTLVNSTGVAALPLFTERSQLETAARRYGWLGPDGSIPAVEVGARQAFHYARAQSLAFVVVDIAADHCVEVTRDEFDPLLSPAARRESSGPFAGAGRISSSLIQAVRPSARNTPAPGTVEPVIRAPTPPPGSLPAAGRPGTSPGTLPAARPASSPGTLPAASDRVTVPEPGAQPRRPPSGALPRVGPTPTLPGALLPSTKLAPPVPPPSDELLERLEAVLRDYPEIEWACAGHGPAGMVIGLRVEPRVRQRVDEIAGRIASTAGQVLPVVLLDDPTHLRAARSEALVFYPWRRR